MKRKIAAILAADAAEYSRLVGEDGEEALRRLVASIGARIASHDISRASSWLLTSSFRKMVKT